jgi:large subunit ribosomal protein L29
MSKTQDALTAIRDLPDGELRQALDRTRDELFRLQLGKHTNQVPSTAEIRTKRRAVAKILTVLRSRELGSEAQGNKQQKAR